MKNTIRLYDPWCRQRIPLWLWRKRFLRYAWLEVSGLFMERIVSVVAPNFYRKWHQKQDVLLQQEIERLRALLERMTIWS